MSHFITQLALEAADDNDSGRWKVTRPLYYASDVAKAVIIVPAGFITDLASVPRMPVIYWLTGNVAAKAAVLHDWNYSTGQFSRAMCDAIFRESSEVIGVSWWRRNLMYLGVRVGGSMFYQAAKQ